MREICKTSMYIYPGKEWGIALCQNMRCGGGSIAKTRKLCGKFLFKLFPFYPKYSRTPRHFLSPHLINNHIPPDPHPPPPKPPHLTPVPLHHRSLPPHPPPRIAHKQNPPRPPFRLPPTLLLLLAPRAAQHAEQHGEGRVQHADVFAREGRGRQHVELDGAGPARFAGHEGCEPGVGAAEEGGVVWVGGDAVGVEGEEDVDCGLRGVLFGGWGFGI